VGGTERTDPYSHSPAFCVHLLRLLHLFSSTIFGYCPPTWPLSFLPRGSDDGLPGQPAAADGVAGARSHVQSEERGRVTDQHEAGELHLLHGVRPGGAGAATVLLPHVAVVLQAPAAASFSQLHRSGGHLHPPLRDVRGARPSVQLFHRFFVLEAASPCPPGGHYFQRRTPGHARYITPI
jgi:hypothetical protein